MKEYNTFTYDLLFSPFMKGIRKKVLKLSGEVKRKKVLEIAFGTGEQGLFYLADGAYFTGVDISKNMVAKAKKKLKQYEHLELMCADATKLEYPNNYFDISTITLALHEMPLNTRNEVIEEMKRVTKGSMIIVDYSAKERSFLFNLAFKIIERFAGRDHHKGYIDFIENGGTHSLIRKHNLKIEEENFIAGKTIVILRLSK